MDGQLLELNIKNLKDIKNVSVFRPSSVICTAMERITTYIVLACLQQILNQRKKATKSIAYLEYNNVW